MKVEITDVEVMVEGEGLAEIETVRVPLGSGAGEIVIAVAKKVGFPAEEAVLLIEDCDEPVSLAVIIDEEFGGRVHHVHRARRVDVAVHYNGGEKHRHFSPATRVQLVLDWAVGKDGFNIDPTIAPELELAIHGQTTALPKNAHIGRYVNHPHHCVAFDIIRGTVPNGSEQ